MPYALRKHICPDCGAEHERRGPAVPIMKCHPCTIANAAEAARQMHAKSGPYYDRWLWQMGTWARKITVTGISRTASRAS